MPESRADRAGPLQLAASVAHEMQTPLATVRGAARALGAGADLDEETRRRLLRLIEDAAAQLALLAGELTLAGRLDAEGLPFELARCEVAPVARAVADAAAAARSGARVDLRLPAGEEPAVLADPDRLHRALGELVENALKHAPDPRADISVERAGEVVRIAVHDAGPGIPAHDRERIFEPYVRLGEREAGSGLGLYLARELVRGMRGEITVDSSPGAGATFTIELPAAP